MKNKRGIEAIIATVLLIAITLLLVAAVVYFVMPLIQDNMAKSQACFNAKVEIKDACSWNAEDGGKTELNFTLARGSEEFKITNITIGLRNGQEVSVAKERYTFSIDEFLPLSEKVYTLYNESAETVKIALVVDSNGKEIQCDYGAEKIVTEC